MPTSNYHQVSDIIGEIDRLSPRSVLDLGVGGGLYGAICRNTLDVRFGRCSPTSWETKIIGYETYCRYENPMWMVYDQVVQADFSGRQHFDFDLVLMIDSLEHLSPDVGRPFLRKLVENNRHVIVSVPNGRMDQGEVYGNPREAHLWTFDGLDEFVGYDYTLIHRSVCTVVSIKGKLE